MGKRFILCDLDGTLVDSVADLANALNHRLARAGRRILTITEVRRLIGDGTRALVEGGFAATGPALSPRALDETLARFMVDYSAHAFDGTLPYPGVVETLTRLQQEGAVLGLCTNKPKAPTRALLAHLDLHRFFSGISAGDSCSIRKPDPGHVQDAMARIGADPASCVMVGDNEHDIAAGKAAGLRTICVTYGYARQSFAQMAPSKLIDHFSELPAALDAIGL